MSYVDIKLQLEHNFKHLRFTSIIRSLHHDIVDLPLLVILDGGLEQSSRLVYGFSAIELRGMENIGIVPSSF